MIVPSPECPLPVANIEIIPKRLRDRHQWVFWRYETRNGKKTKVLYATPTKRAKTNNSKSWMSFDDVLKRWNAWYQHRDKGERFRFDGIGFVFTANDPFCGIDLDDARNPDTGELFPWAKQIVVETMASYAEVSPSGTGVKLWIEGRKPGDRCRTAVTSEGKPWKNGDPSPKAGDIEIYDGGRFFTVTGNKLEGMPSTVEHRQIELVHLFNRLFPPKPKRQAINGAKSSLPRTLNDQEVLKRAESAKNGDKFRQLWSGNFSGYPSQSEADQALCNLLAFWCQGDAQQIDRLFRQSGLFREKWERDDYRDQTINRAIEACNGQFYEGRNHTHDQETIAPLTNSLGIDDELLYTDRANARRLNQLHGADIRYVTDWRKFIHFRGTHWEVVEEATIHGLAKEVADLIINEALESAGEERNELLKWAQSSSDVRRIEAMVKLLRSESGIPIRSRQLDRDIWLFNFPNGTIDFQLGSLRPHRREDLITKLCPIKFDPNAVCPIWEEVIRKIFNAGEESELVSFFQRVLGYTLSGDVREQIMMIFFGHGSNGKSLIVETLLSIFGPDYSCKAPRDFLTQSKGDRHPTEIADLFGKRFVVATETDEGRRLSEGLVKELTGSDTLKARRMREDFWSFVPTHKLALVTNHRPAVRGSDHGIWRRLVLIPFLQRFWNPEAGETGPDDMRQDKELPRKLRGEFEGILAWMVRGCLEWLENGLQIPDSIREATREYRRAEDVIGNFLAECCNDLPTVRTTSARLYQAYRDWCDSNGEHPLRQVEFGKKLSERGYQADRGAKGVRQWVGIALVVESPPEERYR